MSVPVRTVNGMPLRMKILGLSVISAKAREAKLCAGPALNGLSRTPLTTKLCRMSKVGAVIHLKGALIAVFFGDWARNAEVGLTRVVVFVVGVKVEGGAAGRPSRRRGSREVDWGLGKDTKGIGTRRDVASGVSV